MTTDQIEKTILLRAPIARVWRAISDSSEFGSWFGMKVDGQFAPGAVLRGVITPTTVDAEVAAAQKPYEGKPFEIRIERMEPGRLFSMRWHPHVVDLQTNYSAEPTTLVQFVLEQVAEGVMLTITESGFDSVPLERRAQAFTENEQGWSMMIKVIEKYVVHAPYFETARSVEELGSVICSIG
jgi:uncharacterized protein YndB with AHSA1/START domain